MPVCQNVLHRLVTALALTTAIIIYSPASAQDLTEDMVGQNEQAWKAWSAASKALSGMRRTSL
jgi:hypothetical protein